MPDLKQTPLYDFHISHQAKMVPFAGYQMPVQYPLGVKSEHLHTRKACGLFDVSHMGQVIVEGQDVARQLESLIPANLVDLPVGRQRYGLLMNQQGGVRDDLMAVRLAEDKFLLVVNAACKDSDFDWLSSQLGQAVRMEEQLALLALQGPKAQQVFAEAFPAFAAVLDEMYFMDAKQVDFEGQSLLLTRSGYTGEDGFEISLPATIATAFAETLLSHPDCELIGLGARDSLRLEAGLCLYGHELSENVSPIEANLLWAISPARRPGGIREGGYPGADVIAAQINDGVSRKRVGIKPLGRAPVRDGTVLFSAEQVEVGVVCSGGFGPSVEGPVAMAFVDQSLASEGSQLFAEVRGKKLEAQVVDLPFIENTYRRRT